MDYVTISDLEKLMFEAESIEFPSTESAYEYLMELIRNGYIRTPLTAEWRLREINGENVWVCGHCDNPPKSRYWIEPKLKFCPNCGARIIRKDKD